GNLHERHDGVHSDGEGDNYSIASASLVVGRESRSLGTQPHAFGLRTGLRPLISSMKASQTLRAADGGPGLEYAENSPGPGLVQFSQHWEPAGRRAARGG